MKNMADLLTRFEKKYVFILSMFYLLFIASIVRNSQTTAHSLSNCFTLGTFEGFDFRINFAMWPFAYEIEFDLHVNLHAWMLTA